MNSDRIEGQWNQRSGNMVLHCEKLINDEIAAIAGKHEQVVGMLQEDYGFGKKAVKQHVAEYKRTIEELKKSNGRLMDLQNTSNMQNSITGKRTIEKEAIKNIGTNLKR